MRILITGATGHIGSALQKALDRFVSVTATRHSEFDLTQLDRIAENLNRIQPELIINAAAYTAVERAEDEKELAFRVNAHAPGTMAQWAAQHDVPLIHFSTDYVFDGSGLAPWRESDEPHPLSVYGASKLAGEKAVIEANGPHLIVRTSWIYAANGTNFLRTILRLAQERRELRVVADQVGAPTSAPVVAAALAEIIRSHSTALDQRFATTQGSINIAAAGETSWHGFTVAIIEGLRRRGIALAAERVLPISSAEYPSRVKRPANSRLDLCRLGEVFGIHPPQWDRALAAELDELAATLKASAANAAS
jgi:dTDP-4-dehydrorhamnose reductase